MMFKVVMDKSFKLLLPFSDVLVCFCKTVSPCYVISQLIQHVPQDG